MCEQPKPNLLRQSWWVPALIAFTSACGGGGGGGDAEDGLPKSTLDSDGDGLTDAEERDGWKIVVDREGLGIDRAPEVFVRSDPDKADTDGDGLSDAKEFAIRTDPSSADTDMDGLKDWLEWKKLGTNPKTVDSDGDARGPSGTRTPDANLFDGHEIEALGTSPLLADTDGDARSDYEEVNLRFSHPLIADLPELEMEVATDVDVRLNVEYAESLGEQTQYGTAFSASETNSRTSSTSHTIGTQFGISTTVEASAGFPSGASASVSTTVSFGMSYEHSWSSTQETSVTSQTEHSRYVTDSRERSETAASGTISLGMQFRNRGDHAFELDDLIITVLHAAPSEEPGKLDFRAMATLRPEVDSITLAPGEQSPVVQIVSDDVNAEVIKQFLARPDSLVFQPGIYDLRNQEGISFDFLTENTFSRTALIEIDAGGDDVEQYRIATNVPRNRDREQIGITLGQALEELVGLERGSLANGYTVQTQMIDGAPGNKILTGLLGREVSESGSKGRPYSFWAVVGSEGVELDADFGDIVLEAGDEVRLMFTEDADLDGLYRAEEAFYGTSDSHADSDGDGLSDGDEIHEGWIAGRAEDGTLLYSGGGYPRRVMSDPRSPDSDGDGLLDPEELILRTDPANPDTDGDGLIDGLDPFALAPAITLFVDADAPNPLDGTSWATAFTRLEEALADAQRRNTNDPGDPLAGHDDVSQIWVAEGLYHPSSNDTGARYRLQNNLHVYGGFVGVEDKLAQRDPKLYVVRLSGDLKQNDSAKVHVDEPSRADNSLIIVEVSDDPISGLPVTSAVLDGFVIESGNSKLGHGAVWVGAHATPTLRNLDFFRNAGNDGSALIAHGPAVIEDCFFSENAAKGIAGAALLHGNQRMLRCTFTDNSARSQGGAMVSTGGRLELKDCYFRLNKCTHPEQSTGGALRVEGSAFLDRCVFKTNAARTGGAIAFVTKEASAFSAVNTLIQGNTAFTQAGGMYAYDNSGDSDVLLTNCTVAGNVAVKPSVIVAFTNPWGDDWFRDDSPTCGGVMGIGVRVRAVNTLLYNNVRSFIGFNEDHLKNPYVQRVKRDDVAQIWSTPLGQLRTIVCDRNSDKEPSSPWQRYWGLSLISSIEFCGLKEVSLNYGGGKGSVYGDPGIVGNGDMHLSDGSPLINSGNKAVDVDAGKAGKQGLPLLDLDHNARVSGGEVDIGCYEFQF